MKKSAAILIVLGVALLIFGFSLPPYMKGQARTLPTDLDLTVVKESPQGFTLTNHLLTSPTEEVDEIALQVERVLTDQSGEIVSEEIDEVTLIGHSRFPAVGTDTTDSDQLNHEGLHYFFPANALRNSYQYFDLILEDSEPVDYLSREGDVYTFYQNRRFEPMDENTHYSVERTLKVDRHSGIILDKHELMTFHDSATERQLEFSYTEESRELLQSHVDDITSTLETAKILDFFSKFLGLILLGIGVFQTGIFRTRR